MGFSMHLLVDRERARVEARERLRLSVRDRLREALSELIPDERVLIVGSLTRKGRFHERSDIDLAFEALPSGWSPYALASQLEHRMGRSVDLIELTCCRFADKLRREGEWWTA